MKQIILELLKFIKNPEDKQLENQSLKNKLKYLFAFYLFEIVIVFLIILPIHALISNFETITTEPRINYEMNSLLLSLALVVFLAPIIEEIAFRLILRRKGIIKYFFSEKTWHKIFKYLVYASFITFGIIHLSNYENTSIVFYLLSPIIILSQLISGFTLAFLRVKFNFYWSVLSHIFWNFTIVFIIQPIDFALRTPYQTNNSEYNIFIDAKVFSDIDRQKFKIDSANNKIYKVDIQDYSINHILDSIYKFKRKEEDFVIDVNFNSKKGIDKNQFKEILIKYAEE
ncbi:CPBP family intramembrane metalloprotease [Weeksellaceae bacterium TAE3-ERU29]|nr:CPBP family intramembrane metalloprotease [Weeksellaceae bacterium TAE3-ERU29]